MIQVLGLSLLLAAAPPLARFGPPREAPPLSRLTAALRQHLDRAALGTPLERPPERGLDLGGDLSERLLRSMPLTAEQESTAAGAAHRALLAQHKGRLLPPPESARKVFALLTAALPPPLRPRPFRFTLTVLDYPEINAFTCGGGHVYVTRGLLASLSPETEAGRAALALVLAQELGHVALGHCRRGYELRELERDLKGDLEARMEVGRLRTLLETSLAPAGRMVVFLYTRQQQHRADLFGLHLCRNAGLDLGRCLDGLRWLTAAEHPELLAGKAVGQPTAPPLLSYYLSTHPDSLRRLKWLLLEQSGAVEGKEQGLFEYDPHNGRYRRCGDGAVQSGRSCVVFVHGLHGNGDSFRAFLDFVVRQPEAKGQRLLMFRYPNDGSLARAGRFLGNEMARVVYSPERAAFICHSAGGLVFRYYAEKLHGGFRRAALLGTPNGGTRMTWAKTVVDAVAFAEGGWKLGLPRAISATVAEGKGDITPDLEPDSLFLRYLGRDARLAQRYLIVYGRYISSGQALKTWAAYLATKMALEKAIRGKSGPAWIKERGLRMVRQVRLTDEVLNGDLVIAASSARLEGAGKELRVACHHQALKTDPGVMRAVAKYLLAPE